MKQLGDATRKPGFFQLSIQPCIAFSLLPACLYGPSLLSYSCYNQEEEKGQSEETQRQSVAALLFQRALPEVSSDLAYRTSGWIGHMATPRVKGVCDLPPQEELGSKAQTHLSECFQ